MPVKFRRRDNLKGTEAEKRIGIAIRSGFDPLGSRLAQSLKSRAPTDRKRYQKSIRHRVTGSGLKTRMRVFAGADHAEYIEKGRPKGSFPNAGAILGWVRRRGLGASQVSQKTRRAIAAGTRRSFNRTTGKLRTRAQSLLAIQKSIAFLIGRAIKRRGIKGKFHFRDLKQDYAQQISAAIARIRSLVAQHLNQ